MMDTGGHATPRRRSTPSQIPSLSQIRDTWVFPYRHRHEGEHAMPTLNGIASVRAYHSSGTRAAGRHPSPSCLSVVKGAQKEQKGLVRSEAITQREGET